MNKKILFKETTYKELFKELNAFLFICGIKQVYTNIDKKSNYLFGCVNSVMFTETKATIKFEHDSKSKDSFSFYLNISFDKVMLNTALSFEWLRHFLTITDEIENPNTITFRIQGAVKGGIFYIQFGDYFWDATGLNKPFKTINKNKEWSAREEMNNAKFIENILKGMLPFILEFINQPKEYWLTIQNGNNKFIPNIINDLKYGGIY